MDFIDVICVVMLGYYHLMKEGRTSGEIIRVQCFEIRQECRVEGIYGCTLLFSALKDRIRLYGHAHFGFVGRLCHRLSSLLFLCALGDEYGTDQREGLNFWI